ncbi:MAG TPA: FKBP-type peptidyl-prolyl cis-trans isomerase [Streptosporangiaceae bacterium]|nr:FKBP-type peptidyl-prolyl cis-trans isomerase [Streptosporangiaceae bacterium]
MRRIAAALTVPALGILLLAGCGSAGTSSSASSSSSGGSGANTPVTVTGAFGANPQVTIPASKASSNLAIKTVIKGTGATLADTDSFVGNYAVYIWSGTTHKLALSTFTQGTPQVLAAKVGLPGLAKALSGQKMGSRVLAVLPPSEAYGSQGNSQIGVGPNDTVVFVVDLIKNFAPTASATGQQVSSGGGQLPSVKATPGTMPKVTIPAAKEPGKLITKTLIKGSGQPVAKGEEVVTQYVGVNWRTKKVFDSSWSRQQPFGFELDATPEQIIPGWDKGLAGVPAGSRVMLIIPPADGYGKTGNAQAGIKGTDDLVFIVDVLAGVK